MVFLFPRKDPVHSYDNIWIQAGFDNYGKHVARAVFLDFSV